LFIAGTALIGLAIPAAATGGSPPATNTNEVPYWCQQNPGIKFEPVATPFVVPAPPAGYTWTLLVLKAGSTGKGGVVNENETFANPVVGQSYVHSSGKDISHAILCKMLTPTTTTPTTTPTTTVPEETTTTTTSTTVPEQTTTTSTTVPQTTTTTQAVCTNCREVTTVPTTEAPTTTVAATTTVPSKVATPLAEVIPPAVVEAPPAPPELPVTGSMTGLQIAVGIALILAGFAALAVRSGLRTR